MARHRDPVENLKSRISTVTMLKEQYGAELKIRLRKSEYLAEIAKDLTAAEQELKTATEWYELFKDSRRADDKDARQQAKADFEKVLQQVNDLKECIELEKYGFKIKHDPQRTQWLQQKLAEYEQLLPQLKAQLAPLVPQHHAAA